MRVRLRERRRSIAFAFLFALAATGAGCKGNGPGGCTSDVTSDPMNCGACGHACPSTNGSASCTSGTCFLACSAGWGDCDGNAANGCEAYLATDLANCGACGSRCGGAHATAVCASGACTVTCAPGFADCDMNPANGCESDLAADPANCGACGSKCGDAHGTPSCASSTCAIACDRGFANCDNETANGCETATGSDVANCGGCGVTCGGAHGTPSCANGACAIACAAGWANCDGNAANGCEANVATDAANCGACGRACGTANTTSATCAAGACVLACASGFADCDGNPANGCETNTLADAANCGACGRACPSGTACASGGCGGVALATASHVASLAQSTDTLFFATGTDPKTQVGKVAKTGGAVTAVVAVANHRVSAVATDATHLYWLDDTTGALQSVPLAGGAITTLTNVPNNLRPAALFAAGSQALFWADPSSDIVFNPTPMGAPAIAFQAPGGTVYAFTFDATNAYWAGSTGLFAQPISGGPDTPFANVTVGQPAAAPAPLLAADATALYFETPGGALDSVPKTGGSPSTIVAGSGSPALLALTVAGGTLFYAVPAANGAHGAIYAVATTANATPARLATADNVTTLLADATNVYWTDGTTIYEIPR